MIALAEEMGLEEERMAKAMLASGMIGVLIATRWTFAAKWAAARRRAARRPA